ncbi:efflux RND transporter periplasmic adaptor subunit [Candidatus Magnetaquiglobus chichijimensis]|uniref:efflux RND transporter periplasmic adaptor subunit n=1 Tax=Candidatus Magnetaquiglobus chichijimensis TaxID=3141448 RepID=UPI003B96E0C9
MADLLEEDSSPAQTGAVLAALAGFEGKAEAFWSLYLQAVGQVLAARRVLLLSSALGHPWRARLQWPVQGGELPGDPDWTLRLLAGMRGGAIVIDRSADKRLSLAMQPAGISAGEGQVLAVVVLGVAVAGWDESVLDQWAHLAAAIPAQYVRQSSARAQMSEPAATGAPAILDEDGSRDASDVPALEKAGRLHDILRLGIKLSQETAFFQAVLVLCNALALRHGCERVSLGWLTGSGIRLVAMSHVEHFDAHSTATNLLEAVLEEAMEQESLLVYPAPADSHAVVRAHQVYAESLGQSFLTTVPLASGEKLHAVVCLERKSSALSEADLWELALIGEAVTPWLTELRARDRWFLARWWDDIRGQVKVVSGPRHMAWKVAGLGALLSVAVLSWVPWAYRVDATLSIRSQGLLFMPAPFDGYLRQVHVDIGDQVEAGTTLVQLDTRDLLIEESMAEADLVRYTREAEKAQAGRLLAEMQIALARQQQSAARLELIRYQLNNAQVKAPYAGVVIEGELKKNLGAPVRKGDLLLKLAQTTETYLELEIDQANIHEVTVGMTGEFALVGRPDERYQITVGRIDPAAITKEGKTVYLARASVRGELKPSWRPGMGGSAKLEAGNRPLIWVMTQRTVRFLREFFWL